MDLGCAPLSQWSQLADGRCTWLVTLVSCSSAVGDIGEEL
jgi:hypothetical protein